MAGKKFCPQCGSENIELMDGAVSGNWECVECGYFSSVFPEKHNLSKDLDEPSDEEPEEEEILRNKRIIKSKLASKEKKAGKVVKKVVKRRKK